MHVLLSIPACMELDREKALFTRINQDPNIQSFLRAISHSLLRVITSMSLYYSVYDDDPDKPPLLTEIPDIWQLQRNMQRYLRQKQNPNYKDSGSVMPLHVHSVLAIDGNIREQCYQILTLMARERKCRVLKFIFFTTNERLPNCFNDSVLSEYRNLANSIPNVNSLDERITALKKRLFIVSERRQRTRRTPEEAQMGDFGIKANSLVPALSDRELEVVKKYTKSPEDTLPWITGRQQWILNDDVKQALLAPNFTHNLISGLSGHTECMLVLLKLFHCFDLTKLTLVCVVWLCPCQHHSIFEVLATARIHGLPYKSRMDPVDFCHSLLDSIA